MFQLESNTETGDRAREVARSGIVPKSLPGDRQRGAILMPSRPPASVASSSGALVVKVNSERKRLCESPER